MRSKDELDASRMSLNGFQWLRMTMSENECRMRLSPLTSLMYRSWSSRLFSRIIKGDTRSEWIPSQTITLCKSLCFYWVRFFAPDCAQLPAHICWFWELGVARCYRFSPFDIVIPTGCPEIHLPKTFDISVLFQLNEEFFLNERVKFNFLFDIKSFYRYCSNVWLSKSIHTLNLSTVEMKTFFSVFFSISWIFFFNPLFQFVNIVDLRFVYFRLDVSP